MKSAAFTIVEFAARRRADQDRYAERLKDQVVEALESRDFDLLLDEVADVFADVFRDETDAALPEGAAEPLRRQAQDALDKSTPDSDVTATSLMLATAAINAATAAATDLDPEPLVLEWVTMHDDAVRQTHRETEGQQRPPGEPFDVAGVAMPYPGWPGAPIDLWINCRCVIRPAAQREDDAEITAAGTSVWHGENRNENPGVAMADDETDIEVTEAPPIDERVPWHGVLAPEGVKSGDGRMFTNLGRTRDLPLPLTWQETSAGGHDGSITVAMIEKVEMIDGLMQASGHFLSSVEEADEVIGLLAEFGKYGVSVDADDIAEMSFDEDSGVDTFDDPRVCSASIVSIPAFAEAFVALGPHPILDADEIEEGPVEEPEEEALSAAAKVEAIKARAEAESWADIEGFKDLAPGVTEDGPGWLTHPVDTDRLRDYWVRGPGAAKIGWGAPGDFNRCRLNLAEYVKPQYLSGYCANRHKDALGVWPGQEASVEPAADATPAPALRLVAAAGWTAPSEWFTRPDDIPEGEGVVITDEGRVYGYIAEWGVCHVGISGVCTEAPYSLSDYSYFRTGTIDTPDGPVKVGTLTYATGHANDKLRMGPAIAHYDNTGTGWAYVACGEDDRGIWFSGMLRPGLTEDQISEIKASGRLSGDWRGVGGDLELVAALSINTPGFPIIKTSIVAGAQVSLVAAGIVGRGNEEDEPPAGVPEIAALADAIVEAMESRKDRQSRMAALREKVK